MQYGVSYDLTTQGDPNDNAGWTTLTNQGGGANQVLAYAQYYVTDGAQGQGSPVVEAGNTIYLKNGNMKAGLWTLIDNKLATNGKVEVIVPVVDTIKFNQADPIKGFAYYVITGHENQGVGSKGWEKHVFHGHFNFMKTANREEAQGTLGFFGLMVNSGKLIQ